MGMDFLSRHVRTLKVLVYVFVFLTGYFLAGVL